MRRRICVVSRIRDAEYGLGAHGSLAAAFGRLRRDNRKVLLASSGSMNYPATMSTEELLKRITIDPRICHGRPCIRGLRYPVAMLLELMSSGMSHDEILADYEDLEREDLLAALAYAARLSDAKRVALVE